MEPFWPATIAFVGGVVLVAWLGRSRVGRACWRGVVGLSGDPIARMSIVFAIAFLIFSFPLVLGIENPPWVHDEFANLLAADTFLHGRLTNPTPPAWHELQTFHELMRPTYQSKYPPAAGLFLAAGRGLHLAHAGTTAVAALVAVVMGEIFRIWLPPGVALIGALVAATSTMLQLWSSNYWGAGPTVLGGALVLWAVCDVIRGRGEQRLGRRIWRGVICGIGVVILGYSRPLEGLIYLGLCAGWCLCAAIWRGGVWRRVFSMAAWGMPIVIGGAAWQMYYDYRVTGDALTLPYVVHARQYMTMPLLRWSAAPPGPGPEVLARVAKFHEYNEMREYREEDQIGFFGETWKKQTGELVDFFTERWRAIGLVLLPLGFVLRGRRRGAMFGTVLPPLLIAALLLPIQMSVTRWYRINYMAPIFPALLLAIVLSAWWLGRSVARLLGSRVAGGQLGVAVLVGLAAASTAAELVSSRRFGNEETLRFSLFRGDLMRKVGELPSPALVLAREQEELTGLPEVVFNDADPARSPIVFAQSVDAASDARVIEAYPHRTVWRLEVGNETAHLEPDVGATTRSMSVP